MMMMMHVCCVLCLFVCLLAWLAAMESWPKTAWLIPCRQLRRRTDGADGRTGFPFFGSRLHTFTCNLALG